MIESLSKDAVRALLCVACHGTRYTPDEVWNSLSPEEKEGILLGEITVVRLMDCLQESDYLGLELKPFGAKVED